jgi:hypothetical protein
VRAASPKTETVAGAVVRAASPKTETVAGAVVPKVEATAGVTKPPRATPRQADEGGARRSAFVPKEDTEDI